MGWRKYDRQYQHLLPVHLSCKVKAGTDYMSSMHKPWTKTTIEPEMSAQTHAACTWEQRTRISNLVTRDFVALNEKRITSSSLPSKEKKIRLPTRECGRWKLSRSQFRMAQSEGMTYWFVLWCKTKQMNVEMRWRDLLNGSPVQIRQMEDRSIKLHMFLEWQILN